MKNCPACKRTYSDETLTFCLVDGAILSAPYDPHATLIIPAARDTDPQGIGVLSPERTPVKQAPVRSTDSSFAPVADRQEARQSNLTEKRSGKYWIIFAGTLALVTVGLAIALGYMSWKASNKSASEPSRASSTAPTKSNVPTNANRDAESKPRDDMGLNWLDGVWEGQGFQSNTKTTWDVKLTAQDGTYTVDYPNIPCQGRWALIEKNAVEAKFVEVFTKDTDRCANNGNVYVGKINDSQISCKYTYPPNRDIIATAILNKKSK
ncbi:MAG: hypothetical protein WCF57_13255 [Pyrinomonadaceae bacterium]